MRALRALSVLLLLLWTVVAAGSRVNLSEGKGRCKLLVQRWARQAIWDMEGEGTVDLEGAHKWELQDVLFFLHVPRTGGRNYNQCFLKNLFTSKQLCPRSYDKLRLDLSKPNCSLLSTHDDFSILSRLNAKTSTITNIRDPMNRVLSAYEFSVEVAARFLRRAPSLLRRISPKTQKAMSTLDIWPWRYLVPLIQVDLFERRDLRAAHLVERPGYAVNMYDVPSFVMPLKEFVDHPAVHELIHNGQTFQVAGITNNSFLKEANEIRYCVSQYEELGEHVLHVAKRRLNSMLYVGLTERHKESAEILMHLVGRQVALRNFFRDNSPSKQTATYPDYLGANTNITAGNDTSYGEFISQMVTSYEQCSSSLRSAQVQRRIVSLESIAPVNFTKEARKAIPDDIVARILQLNSLDYELYQHAKKLFQVEKEFLERHRDEMEKFELETSAEKNVGVEERIATWHENKQHPEVSEAAAALKEDDQTACYVLVASVLLGCLCLHFLARIFFRRARARGLQKK